MLHLPFTEAEFLKVFAQYNRALWPVAMLLWLASVLALAAVLRRRPLHGFISTLIAAQWAWAGAAYHLLLFTRINPAARVFGWMFLLQAGLVIWMGWSGEGLRYVARGPRRLVGVAFAAYGLLYPILAILVVHPYPETPTFGVPCPTALFTTGLLLLVTPARRLLLVIPLLWSIIGGSAAILLGVETDFALLLAGAALLIALLAPRLLDHRGDSEAMFA